jgi:hypothetical protein
LASALSRGLDGVVLDSRGVRVSLPQLFKSSFKNTDLSPTFRLEAEFEYGRYSCSIRSGRYRSSLEFHSEELFDGKTKVFGRGPNGTMINPAVVSIETQRMQGVVPSRGFWDVLSPFANISDGLRAELAAFSEYSIYAPQTAIMRGVASDLRVTEPLGLTGSNLAGAFSEALNYGNTLSDADHIQFNKILSLIWAPGWANRVNVAPTDPNIVPAQVSSGGGMILYIRDKFMKTNRNMLSTFDASEGTLYLIFVATLLLHPYSPSTFGLDNVDGTLNSRLVRLLTDKLVEVCTISESEHLRAYQCFVTSHHPASLDSFDIFDDSQKVFVTRRRDDPPVVGSTYFDQLLPRAGSSKAEWIAESGGRNLSELLLEGFIPGGL